MKIVADGFEIDFSDAIDAFVFDEKDSSKPTFHGAPMKAVDVIVEFEDVYLFVEIKDFHDPSIFDIRTTKHADIQNQVQEQPLSQDQKNDNFKWLKNYLKYKYRDSLLYRYAEDKADKPIRYICLLSFETGLNCVVAKVLKQELPIRRPRTSTGQVRWVRDLVLSCEVINLAVWNKTFPKWPARKI